MDMQDHNEAYHSPEITQLREDLALALRAAAHHGLAEGVCNHFSLELPDQSDRFLLNPRGLLWQEIAPDDIVLINTQGDVLAGSHPVESTAMFIHSAIHRICKKTCVLHTHMPHATALSLTQERTLNTTLSQTAMRFHGRVSADEHYNGLALDVSEGERIAQSMNGADIVFLGNHGVVVCADRMDYAYDDLYYLERACELEVLARSTGQNLIGVEENMAQSVSDQTLGERLQSELFFKALKRVI
ncbi:MAG: aldolase [Burkholderiales bacterium]|nr:aldolase [Burkholderiales bacterium]